MFKKTMLLGTVLLVSACSSNTASTDYVNDVVVQKNAQTDYVETVGKEIVPVDLLELNLGLKMSVLSVTSRINASSEQVAAEMAKQAAAEAAEAAAKAETTSEEQAATKTAEAGQVTEAAPVKDEATITEEKTTEQTSAASDELSSDVFFKIEYTQAEDEKDNQYNVAIVDGDNVSLVENNTSKQCKDKLCAVTQSFSFPIKSALLINAKVDGLKFSLLETSNNNKLMLETMIPGRYITALLAE